MRKNSWNKVIQRTDGYNLSILAQNRTDAIDNEHYMQYDAVVTRVGMMLVGVPIAATDVELDIAGDAPFCRVRVCGRELKYGIANIWSLRPAGPPGIVQIANLTARKRQRLRGRQGVPALRKVLFENLRSLLRSMVGATLAVALVHALAVALVHALMVALVRAHDCS